MLDENFNDGVELVESFESTVTSYEQGYEGTKAVSMTYNSAYTGFKPAIRFPLSREIRNACINPGTTIGISFKAKLLNVTDNNSEMSCNITADANCPEARLRIKNLEDGGSINDWIEDLPLGFSSPWNPVSFVLIWLLLYVDLCRLIISYYFSTVL